MLMALCFETYVRYVQHTVCNIRLPQGYGGRHFQYQYRYSFYVTANSIGYRAPAWYRSNPSAFPDS